MYTTIISAVKGRSTMTTHDFCKWENTTLLSNLTLVPEFPRRVSVTTCRRWLLCLSFSLSSINIMVNDMFYSVSNAGCSVGYKLDAYPQFKGINSQTVEQSNSTLKRIKPSLSYMNAGNFMNHMQLYLWFRNLKQSKVQS